MGQKKNIHVMIVDHRDGFITQVKQFLENKGLIVCTAHSALEAFDCLRHAKIQVVLQNADLPSVDGLEVLRHIRRRHRSVQVLVLHDRVLSKTEHTVFRLMGAFDLLNKPVDLKDLFAKIMLAWMEAQRKQGVTPKSDREFGVHQPVAAYGGAPFEQL